MSHSHGTHNDPRRDHLFAVRPVCEHGSHEDVFTIHTRAMRDHETRHHDFDALMTTQGLTARGLSHEAEKLQDHTLENDMNRIRVKIAQDSRMVENFYLLAKFRSGELGQQ